MSFFDLILLLGIKVVAAFCPACLGGMAERPNASDLKSEGLR